MKTRVYVAGVSLGALVLAAVGAVPVQPLPPATGPATAPATRPHWATAADLGGAARYLTALSTDKPIYRANERVYARAVLLDAATHQPLAAPDAARPGPMTLARIQVVGPRGEIVAQGSAYPQDSVAGFAWTVPETAAGGEYTLKIEYPQQGYAPAQRKFDVRIYRAPRLRSQITFIREGYGPGDKVQAVLHTERAEGGLPAGAKVTITARVDETQVFITTAAVDATGNCKATFDLPPAMSRGEGTLAFAIEDGGTVETSAKTIPILLQTVDLSIYPEGGDAVAGLDTRYYIEAKTPAKKPADLVGAIVDATGKEVAKVRTEHEGRGRFDFTPAKGQTYTLKLTEPVGISKTWTLPAAKDHGIALQGMSDTVAKNQPVKLKVAATDAGTYKVTLTRHEADAAEPLLLNLKAGAAAVAEFKPRAGFDGVLTATVWDEKDTPLAERLVFVQPAHSINVQIAPNQTTYAPGGQAKIDITTTDETGKPVSAVVGLTVTDDTVLEMIEKREQAPRLPVMVLLEPEVREIADAQVYLDAGNPKAALATDLLLGTQGWRRFALYTTDEFLSKYGDDAKRAVALVKPTVVARRGGGALAFNAVGGAGGAGGFGGGGRGGRGGAAPGAAVNGDLLMRAAAQAGAPQDALQDKAAFDAPQRQLAAAADAAIPPAAAAMPVAPGGGGGGGGGFAGGGGAGRGGRGRGPVAGAFLAVREYAHAVPPNWSPNDRTDFAETLYFNPAVKTDDTGHGSASFAMSDSVTSFRIFADSFSRDGALGSSTKTIESIQPFYIEAKMPLEVTAGDVIQLPVTAINNLPDGLKDFTLTLAAGQGLKVEAPTATPGELTGGQRLRAIYKITAGDAGTYDLTVAANAGQYSDKVTRKLTVKPKGFPTQLAYGGLLDKDTGVKKEFTIPASMVRSSLQSSVTVYPSPMANLTEAVASLMRQPNGCFEQTSSTNYPLAMAQQYFINHQGVDPKLIGEANVLLGQGYQRLVGFECQAKGYEWFGGSAPGHEALTAYGLMEFRDMQKANLAVVDDAMVERTRVWLLARRDGKGSFQRNQRALDTFGGAPELTTNAYIVWALLQAGEKNLDLEINAVREGAKASDDSYVLALAANICNMVKDDETAHTFMDKLARKQNKEGAVDGAQSSITRSGGQGLQIEATSLASLAWESDAKKYAGNNQSAIQFLADSCKGGRFGSTQSTILALKAITAYDQSQAHPKEAGEVRLVVDNKPVGDAVPFTADTKNPLKFPDISALLTPGDHNIALQMTAGSQMPFSVALNYNSLVPSTDKECKLDLQTWLKDAQISEGGITEARVVLTNNAGADAPTPIAIIGIPGGLEVRHDQLKELVKAGKIDAYEVLGREVVLYWRQLKAESKADVSISLTAGVPGIYTAPASRTYLYYTDEYKQWNEGTTVTITPK